MRAHLPVLVGAPVSDIGAGADSPIYIPRT